MPPMIVIVRAKAKKGSEVLLEKAVKAVMPLTHKEEGCLKYTLNRSLEDPTQFAMVEKWVSKEALDKHLASPYIQDLFKKLPDLLAAPIELQAFQSIPEGSPEKSNI